MPENNVSQLIKDWIAFARENNIRANITRDGKKVLVSDGNPPEDTDLLNFLKLKGYEEDLVRDMIDDLPEAESTPEPEGDAGMPQIDVGTTEQASDGNVYRWAGKRWVDAESLSTASPEINAELNAKFTKAENDPTSEPEPTPDQGDEVSGISKDELDDIGQEVNPEPSNNRRAMRQMQTLISQLNKEERQYLKRLLQR